MNFCDVEAVAVLQSYVIVPGSCLLETENITYWSLTREFLKQCLTERKTVICKVVAYRRW